jgi:hypothetical protein
MPASFRRRKRASLSRRALSARRWAAPAFASRRLRSMARFELGVVGEVVEDHPFVAPPMSAPVSRLRVVAAARPKAPARLRAAAGYEEF